MRRGEHAYPDGDPRLARHQRPGSIVLPAAEPLYIAPELQKLDPMRTVTENRKAALHTRTTRNPSGTHGASIRHQYTSLALPTADFNTGGHGIDRRTRPSGRLRRIMGRRPSLKSAIASPQRSMFLGDIWSTSEARRHGVFWPNLSSRSCSVSSAGRPTTL